MRGGKTLKSELESKNLTDSKKLPKEYLILKLRMSLNKDLLDKKIISFDIYNKMQNLLIRKMDKIILENIDWKIGRSKLENGYN